MEAILVHTVSGKYGGSYSTRKDGNALRRHCNINWKPCGPVEKTAQQSPDQRSILTKGKMGQSEEEAEWLPRACHHSARPGGDQKGVIASTFLASVIEFLRVWFTIVEKLRKKGGHSRCHDGLGVFTVHNYHCNPVGSSYPHCAWLWTDNADLAGNWYNYIQLRQEFGSGAQLLMLKVFYVPVSHLGMAGRWMSLSQTGQHGSWVVNEITWLQATQK